MKTENIMGNRSPESSPEAGFSRVAVIGSAILFLAFASAFGKEAGSSTGSETVRKQGPNADMYTDNWRQGAATGTRVWNAAADSMSFTWNTPSGFDQIGRIGKDYTSPGLANVKVDDVRSNCIMTATANLKSVGSGGYMWGVYGWTGDQSGKKVNEFYVMYQNTFNSTPGQSGYIDIGSVTIDGFTFACVKNLHMPWAPSQNQYMAILKSGPWASLKPTPWTGDFSIDLKKVFAYFRLNGLPNEYVVDLTWGIEAMGGTHGQIIMTKVVVPDLKASTHLLFNSRALVVNPAWQAGTRLFAVNGRIRSISPETQQPFFPLIRVNSKRDGDGSAAAGANGH
ncbi:MAG: hypothetical protein JWP91_4019 [Fibrobacteres bacterium]|nr:hypothetical protein [Fibrobacterota bacterium]